MSVVKSFKDYSDQICVVIDRVIDRVINRVNIFVRLSLLACVKLIS